MARSAVYLNWSDASFSYGTTPTVVAINEVEDCQVMRGGQPVFWSGDAAPGPTHKKVVDRRREITLIGADIGRLAQIPEGVRGTLTIKLHDFDNGPGEGSLAITLANCSVDTNEFAGQHNQVGKGNLKFTAVWGRSGGSYVDPLAITETPPA